MFKFIIPFWGLSYKLYYTVGMCMRYWDVYYSYVLWLEIIFYMKDKKPTLVKSSLD